MEFTFTTFPNLITDRLVLRELNFNDVKAIFELRSSKEINKLISRETPKNIEEAKEFIKVCHQEFKNENRVFWAIELEDKVIGTIVYHKISLQNRYAEIGYELNPNYQQKGFMSKALKTVLDFGFHQMNLKTIEAFTHKNNIASIALLEKYHFKYQPERKCKSFEHNRIFKIKKNK